MAVAKGRGVAIGNVHGSKSEKTSQGAMVADVRRCIDAAARHSAFILSTSCEIPPRSEPEIVKWFIDAAREYSRHDHIFYRAEPATPAALASTVRRSRPDRTTKEPSETVSPLPF